MRSINHLLHLVLVAVLVLACNGDSGGGNDGGGGKVGGGKISCGAGVTCDLSVEVCCVTPDGSALSATPSSQFQCDGPEQCAGDKICCGEDASPFFNTSCVEPSKCGGANRPFIC